MLRNLFCKLPKNAYLSYILFGLSAFVLISLGYHSLATPLGYDEAYNLQVVDNLIKGKGYASYGAIRGEGPWVFDPHVTTGPVILVPLAVSWWITGGSLLTIRMVMLLFSSTYILAILNFVGITREKLAISAVAVASPLIVVFSPERVLGEVPAAAAIIWAAYGVSKNKPLIAGLAVGLAVQIKLAYGLAGAAVLLSWLVVMISAKNTHWFRNVLVAGAAAAVPTICFEFYRFISLGSINNYADSLGELRVFLVGEKIGNWLDPNAIGTKIVGLYQSIVFPGWIAVALAAVVLWIAVVIVALSSRAQLPDDADPQRTGIKESLINYSIAAHVGLTTGGLLMLWGWFTQSSQLASRQGLPALLLFLPTLATVCACVITSGNLFTTLTSSWRWILRAMAGVGLACLIVALILKGVYIFRDTSGVSGLEEQRRVAELIRKSGATSIAVDGWWQNPEFQLLTGLPGIPIGYGSDRQLLVVQNYQVALTGTDWVKYKADCADVIYESPDALLCWPLPVSPVAADFKIVDWGPKSTSAGVVPNIQPDGGAGIWISIEKGDKLGPVKVLFSGRPATASYQTPSGDLITASIQPRQFLDPGYKDVAIKQMSTGKIVPVGKFLVESGK